MSGSETRNVILDFLDWSESHGFRFCEIDPENDLYWPVECETKLLKLIEEFEESREEDLENDDDDDPWVMLLPGGGGL